MTFENAEIYGHLSTHAAALESFDAERATELYGIPATILTDESTSVAQTRDELVTLLARTFDKLQRLGLGSVGSELLEVSPLSERLARVRVRWIYHDKNGTVITAISYIYVVRRDDDGVLRAYLALPLEENDKLARSAKRRGISFAD